MSDRIDRRSFLARGAATTAGLAVIGSSGSLLAACSSSSSSSSTTGGTASHPNGVSTATPQRGGKLVFGTEAEESGFDPTTATYDATGLLYARTVFDPLAAIDTTGKVQPYLAQAITPNADYTTWVITMRPNVMFHDNTPCDAAALVTNLTAQKASLLIGQTITNIASFSATGPLEVTINMKTPWVPFDYYLCGGIGAQFAYVVAPSMLTNPHGTTNPVGTGPFVFAEWVQNDHFTANKNPNYWRTGLPYLDTIEYRPIPDSDQLYNSLVSGSVDIMHSDTPSVIKNLRANSSLAYIDDSGTIIGEPDMGCLLLNLSKAPFDNLKVRQAAAMTISSSEYVKVIDDGINPTSNGPFVPGTPFYSADGYPAFNPTMAAQLVKEVQQETGKPVTVVINHIPDSSTVKIAQFLQQELQTAGMTVTLAPVQQASLISTALEGQFEAQVWRQFSAIDPDLNYIFWSSTTVNSALSINMTRNSDPTIEAALIKGRQSPNPSDRAAAYQAVAEGLGKDIPYIWYDRTVWAIAAESKVENFNNLTLPGGQKGYSFYSGAIWPTQIWLQS